MQRQIMQIEGASADEATTALVERLRLEEKEAQEREDHEVAARIQREDHKLHNKIADEEFASRMQREETEREVQEAALADEALALRLQREDLEWQKIADEQTARAIYRELNAGLGPNSGHRPVHGMDDEALARYVQAHDRIPNEEPKGVAGPTAEPAEASATAAARPPVNEVTTTCTSCLEEIRTFEAAILACNHAYCRDCINRMFESALQNDASFPAKCCQPIPIETVRYFLPADLVRRYETKKVEMDTPDKTYCSNRQDCGKFIPTENIRNGSARCATCNWVTCAKCGTREHGGDCPADVGKQQALDLAREKRWQRCFSCKQGVELSEACNHIFCTCGAEFCYLCGEIWKKCQCPLWGAASLAAMANAIVANPEPQDDGNGDDPRLWPFLDNFHLPVQPIQAGAAQPPQPDDQQLVPLQGPRPAPDEALRQAQQALVQRQREIEAVMQGGQQEEEHYGQAFLEQGREDDIDRRIRYLIREDLSFTIQQLVEHRRAVDTIIAHLRHDPTNLREALGTPETTLQLLLNLPARLRPDGRNELEPLRDNGAHQYDAEFRRIRNAVQQMATFYGEFFPNFDNPGERERFHEGFQDRLRRAMQQNDRLERLTQYDALIRYIEANIPPRLV